MARESEGGRGDMGLTENFVAADDQQLMETFLAQGYIVREVANREGLDALRAEVVQFTCRHLGIAAPTGDLGDFLDAIHDLVPVAALNDLRFGLYNYMNAKTWFRPSYYSFAKPLLDVLVGNELSMQNRINFSIQMAGDDSSILAAHVDAFSGETPFQAVQWLPLVDVADSKAMFILPPEKNRAVIPGLRDVLEAGGSAAVFEAIKDDLVWVPIPYGHVMVFSPNLLHGNVLNTTGTTRWSMNSRFTGLFTPYFSEEKSLGGFYLPITPRPVSRVGMAYDIPDGFKGSAR
jgi:sporadic carbohydrate cluster 2OG-Fe(II) oxygenase